MDTVRLTEQQQAWRLGVANRCFKGRAEVLGHDADHLTAKADTGVLLWRHEGDRLSGQH
jgi:hypothetical protein